MDRNADSITPGQLPPAPVLVSVAADTINVGLLSGLVTGDSVTYLKGAPANTAIVA